METNKEMILGFGEVAPWTKAFTGKPGDPGFILSTHTVEGQRQLPEAILWVTQTLKDSLFEADNYPKHRDNWEEFIVIKDKNSPGDPTSALLVSFRPFLPDLDTATFHVIPFRKADQASHTVMGVGMYFSSLLE